MLFFDLEFYVPEEDRKKSKISLRFRAPKDKHVLLGGVFVKVKDYQVHRPKKNDFKSFWIWNEQNYDNDILCAERRVVASIYRFFKNTWEEEYDSYIKWRRSKKKETKTNPHYDLRTCGTGIARVDLPTLYIKGNIHKVADPNELFEVFLATTPLDLTDVAIPIVKPKGKIIKPIPTTDILKHFNLGEKESGQKVWELYETKKFKEIEQRTLEEVKLNIEIFYKIKNILKNKNDHVLS